jgi:hypothetical protein
MQPGALDSLFSSYPRNSITSSMVNTSIVALLSQIGKATKYMQRKFAKKQIRHNNHAMHTLSNLFYLGSTSIYFTAPSIT